VGVDLAEGAEVVDGEDFEAVDLAEVGQVVNGNIQNIYVNGLPATNSIPFL